MCGIVGYIGYREAYPILIKGLKRLEYRGYDSAGVALMNSTAQVFKKKGKVSDLEEHVGSEPVGFTIGMGHTRWATHGEPSDINSHPHKSQSGKFIIIHNGIIENYASLKNRLLGEGYEFTSATDTEILAQFIDFMYQSEDVSAEEAVRLALNQVVGAYGIIVMCEDEPEQLIVARKSSPIVVGIGENEYIIASDASPIIAYTKDVIYLNDNEMAILTKNSHTIKTIENEIKTPLLTRVEMELEELEKGGYEHFMLKEIFEQPTSIADSLRGRVKLDTGEVYLGGLDEVRPQLAAARRIIMVACGTSWHAGLVGEYLFEEFARVPVEVEYASEFRYRNPLIFPDDVVIAISQSGETADTLAAVREATEKGALVAGLVNVVGSTIARETGRGVYLHAGPEISVASTKAFTCQVATLLMVALKFARSRRMSVEQGRRFVQEIESLPNLVRQVLAKERQIAAVAERYVKYEKMFFIGRGYLYPVAMEGALKLKEISYIHAEAYHAAELKHGPIALLEESMPVVALALEGPGKEKTIGNIKECSARNARVLGIITEGDEEAKSEVDDFIEIPACRLHAAVVPATVALQLFSYHVARLRGCAIDQPRNLAKSVTVE